MLAKPADRIVLDGSLGLRAVKSVVRNLDLAEGVAFDSHGSGGSWLLALGSGGEPRVPQSPEPRAQSP
jgi:hypothetical protein